MGGERHPQRQDGLFHAVHPIKSLTVEVFPRPTEAVGRFHIAFVAEIRHHLFNGNLQEYETKARKRQRGI